MPASDGNETPPDLLSELKAIDFELFQSIGMAALLQSGCLLLTLGERERANAALKKLSDLIDRLEGSK